MRPRRFWTAPLRRVERFVLEVLISLLVTLVGRRLRKRFERSRRS